MPCFLLGNSKFVLGAAGTWGKLSASCFTPWAKVWRRSQSQGYQGSGRNFKVVVQTAPVARPPTNTGGPGCQSCAFGKVHGFRKGRRLIMLTELSLAWESMQGDGCKEEG